MSDICKPLTLEQMNEDLPEQTKNEIRWWLKENAYLHKGPGSWWDSLTVLAEECANFLDLHGDDVDATIHDDVHELVFEFIEEMENNYSDYEFNEEE